MPVPDASISFALVTSPLLLLSASERSSCNVKLLTVILPTKNLLPPGTANPDIDNNELLPSSNCSSLIASPVVNP